MSVSEAQKRANRKYDSEKMTYVGCKISKEKAARFKDACNTLGTSQYAVLKEAVEYTIEKAKRPEE